MQDTSKTLQLIADNTEVVVKLPWNGVYGWYRILILNSTQLQACGAFTLIQLADSEKLSEEESIDALLELKNAQERMFRMALVEPTFEQILEVYKATDAWASVLEKERVVKEALTGMEMSEEKVELEQEFHLLQMFKGFVFPDDFASALTEMLYQKNNSDIMHVSEEMLLRAAILAGRGHSNPHEYLSGNFTDYHKQDIDNRAWYLLEKHKENKKTERGTRWFGR